MWIALVLTFSNGPRVGNVTIRDGPTAEDHCIRAGDMLFTFQEGDELVTASGGQEVRDFVGGCADRVKMFVSSCKLSYMTS